MTDGPDITGEWDGVYVYGGALQNQPPVRFRLVLRLSGATALLGTIQDAEGLGDANVVGTVEGRALRFVKTYYQTRYRGTVPIHYEGAFSDDGRYLSGIWRLEKRFWVLFRLHAEGIWQTHRPGTPEPPLIWPPPPQPVQMP